MILDGQRLSINRDEALVFLDALASRVRYAAGRVEYHERIVTSRAIRGAPPIPEQAEKLATWVEAKTEAEHLFNQLSAAIRIIS